MSTKYFKNEYPNNKSVSARISAARNALVDADLFFADYMKNHIMPNTNEKVREVFEPVIKRIHESIQTGLNALSGD
jgi:hypothetical protein